MNATTFALGAMFLLASLAIAPGPAVADAPSVETSGPDCDFITFVPHFPFIIIDWDCPPIAGLAAAAF